MSAQPSLSIPPSNYWMKNGHVAQWFGVENGKLVIHQAEKWPNHTTKALTDTTVNLKQTLLAHPDKFITAANQKVVHNPGIIETIEPGLLEKVKVKSEALGTALINPNSTTNLKQSVGDQMTQHGNDIIQHLLHPHTLTDWGALGVLGAAGLAGLAWVGSKLSGWSKRNPEASTNASKVVTARTQKTLQQVI